MSIQLQPLSNFAIVRQLPDPSDSTTYYVSAQIRNAQTDALIDTVNLTDKGERRFIGIWRASADKTGQGLLISIRTTVYTDSGYTTKSQNYAEEMETYLILERFNPNEVVRQLGPALGGEDFDYERLRKMINEIVEKKVEPIKNAVDAIKIPGEDKAISSGIKEIKEAISAGIVEIKKAMPVFEKDEMDFTPVSQVLDSEFDQLRGVLEEIKTVVSKEPEKVDFTPVMSALERIENKEGVSEQVIEELDRSLAKITQLFEEKHPAMLETANKLIDKFRDIFLYSKALPEKPKEIDPKEKSMARANELLNL